MAYENWNKNQALWKNIEKVVEAINNLFSGSYDREEFKNFALEKICYLQGQVEDSTFVNVGSYSINKQIEYIEGRDGANSKKWDKYKSQIESCFKMIFPNFKTPEQSHKPVTNPLMNKTSTATLVIEDFDSGKISYKELCKKLSIPTDDNIFEDHLTFQFKISKDKTFLENPVKTGINQIEDQNAATIVIDMFVEILNPADYCKRVINSSSMSEALFYNYLEQQLFAYFGYNEYPSEQINILQVPHYFFNVDQKITGTYRVAYPSGQIYYIPQTDLSYDQYIAATKSLYDDKSKQLIGNLYDLQQIKNKVLNVDQACLQLVYTDSYADIQKLDFSSSEPLSYQHKEFLLNLPIGSDTIQDFLRVLKGIYYRIDNKIDFDSVVGAIDRQTALMDINLQGRSKYSQLFDILEACNSHWQEVNFDLITKCKNKIFVDLLLYFQPTEIQYPEKLQRSQIANLHHPIKLPAAFNKILCGENDQQNQLLDFPAVFRNDLFIAKIANLLINGAVKRPAVITFDTLNFYNRLAYLTDNQYNGLIIDEQTLPKLYQQFGSNLLNYLRTLPINTFLIIHPNAFFQSSILGDSEGSLANKISYRNLVAELLTSIPIDYAVFFKQEKLDLKDLVPSTIRRIFARCKYRVIYGKIDYNDSLIVDPNCNLLGESNLSDLKSSASISKEEASALTYICQLNPEIYQYTLPTTNIQFFEVKPTKTQTEYYKQMVDTAFERLQSDQDFKQAVITSDLDNGQQLSNYLSNFLTTCDVFLNAPDSSDYLFKEKFEDLDNPNLVSTKVEEIYNICNGSLFGGIIRENRVRARSGKVVVVCENRAVCDHIYKNLQGRFKGISIALIKNLSEDAINAFNSECQIVIIAKDILAINPNLGQVSTFINVQNSWNMEYLQQFNDCVQANIIYQSQKPDSINIYHLVFDRSLEVNKLYNTLAFNIQNKYNQLVSSDQNASIINAIRSPVKIKMFVDQLDILEFTEVIIKGLVDKYLKTLQYDNHLADVYKQNLLRSLVNKTDLKISEQVLADLTFSEIAPADDLRFGLKGYVPFINNMYLNFFQVQPHQVDEYYSDLEGNRVLYTNQQLVVQPKAAVVTEYGCGNIADILDGRITVDVINFGTVVIDSDKFYAAPISCASRFFSYIQSIQGYGDSTIRREDIEITKLDSKQQDIRTDQANNAVEINAGVVDGLFSLYASNIDADNARLQNFNFDKFSNIFTIEISDLQALEKATSLLSRYDGDQLYISAIHQAFRHFDKQEKFILPSHFNYFQDNQIKHKEFRAYPTVWNDKFLILINGNFYQKTCYRLSRKIPVNLVKSLYIQSFDDLKSCRFELIKISKTLDVTNLQQTLQFFNRDFEKAEILNITKPDTAKHDIQQKQDTLQMLKQREARLKQRIKTLRENKSD